MLFSVHDGIAERNERNGQYELELARLGAAGAMDTAQMSALQLCPI
jgi:hypothetical protein